MHIDSHQQFWIYRAGHPAGIPNQINELKRDFLPQDLKPLLRSTGFDGCVAVQARQTPEETRWLLELADRHSFICGVVGWVDLRSSDVTCDLDTLAQHPKFRGVCHVTHDEPDDPYLFDTSFRHGIAQLGRRNLTYDLQVLSRHLPAAANLVEAFPHQRFVLDHLGSPAVPKRRISRWRTDLAEVAKHPNVFCRLSGLAAGREQPVWRSEHVHRALDVVMEAFGPRRAMIGSHWPACTELGSYAETMQRVLDYTEQFTPEERAGILGTNCEAAYRLPPRPTVRGARDHAVLTAVE